MVKHLHLISGLPRSGSTLLCALLRQNPRYTAAMTSPVAMLCGAMHQKMCDPEFGTFFDDEKRARMLRGVFDNNYLYEVTLPSVKQLIYMIKFLVTFHIWNTILTII